MLHSLPLPGAQKSIDSTEGALRHACKLHGNLGLSGAAGHGKRELNKELRAGNLPGTSEVRSHDQLNTGNAMGVRCRLTLKCAVEREPCDPVTGAAHCMLTPYWANRLGKTAFRAFQASPRGGEVLCRLRGDRVELEGSCVFYLEGEVEL